MIQSLVIIQILPALNNGGVERGTVEMANFLAQQGHTSIVISASGLMRNKLSNKVEHINLDIGKKSLFTLFKTNILKNIFIEKKADIVHARSRLPAWLAIKAIAKIKSKKPKFVTTVHGLYSVKKYSSIMARGDKVIAVSQTSADYVTQNYGHYLKSKPCVIYRGIDTDEFSYGHQPDPLWLKKLYEKHNQLVNKKIVLLPGRLTSLKGIKDLLIWLKSINNEAKLVLTADPNNDFYAERLNQWFIEQKIEDKVVWIGIQSKMADIYAIADVVVNTSKRAESFGRTVAESLAVGTPVVAYNHGGVSEILTQIFPQGKVTLNNQQELSDTINKVLSDKPVIENKQPFLLSNMLEDTLSLYQELSHEI